MRELLGQSGETRGDKSDKVEAAWRIPNGQRHKELGKWEIWYANKEGGRNKPGPPSQQKATSTEELVLHVFSPSFCESCPQVVKVRVECKNREHRFFFFVSTHFLQMFSVFFFTRYQG